MHVESKAHPNFSPNTPYADFYNTAAFLHYLEGELSILMHHVDAANHRANEMLQEALNVLGQNDPV